MKIEKITNTGCFYDFSHGAVIKTESGRSLGATSDPREAENIIRTYFQTEFFPNQCMCFLAGKLDRTEYGGALSVSQSDAGKPARQPPSNSGPVTLPNRGRAYSV